ncbi:MAG: hypothetical protein ACTHOP_25185 [Mesorhizobium sp.]
MSTLPVNGARGEVALRIGNVDLVIAAEMERLSALSTAMGFPALAEFQRRLVELEVSTAVLAVRHLTVLGDADAAIRSMRLSDFAACSSAFVAALNHHFDGKEGKDGAATEAAATSTQASASGNG